jgi:hypothetical protein
LFVGAQFELVKQWVTILSCSPRFAPSRKFCCDSVATGEHTRIEVMGFGSGLTRAAQMLTHRSIEAMRPAGAAYRVPDQRCKGLAVRVAPSGVKTWDLAYRIRGTGKMRRLSLGRTSDIGLEQARERANELTSAARGGRDLIAEEDEARAAAASRITVEALIDLYLRRRSMVGCARRRGSRAA